MSDEGKEQRVGLEPDNTTATRNFIETHKALLTPGLIDILQSSRVVLLGDAHIPAGERLRASMAESLPLLKTQGGVTGVAVELDSTYQQRIDDLKPDNPDLEKIIEGIGAPVGWYQGNITFLATAKRLGLKVICIDLVDKQKADSQRDNALWQNQRDTHMFEVLERMITTEDKIFVLVGNDHIQKRSVKKYNDGSVIPLGMCLVEKYGDTLVKSIRSAYREGLEHFDNLLPFMSKTPRVAEVITKEEPIVIVPDEGPIKGDPRVTATDYVAIA